jgi:large exoprotein involved in heme utilization and adhesion
LAENQPPSNIHIRAIENVDLKNTSQVSANTFSSRDAGRIVIETSQLELDGNSRLEATAEEGASGNGGEILINASRFIKLSQGSIINALTDGAGPGGTIIIHSSQLSVDTGAAIVAQTFAEGQGGDIKINVINLDVNGIDKDMVNRSAILINSSGEIDEDVGDGGTLEIRAKTLQVSDGGLISVGTRTRGDAGNIVLQVSDFIKVRGIATVIDSEINENGIEQIKPSAISSSSRNAGDAGNLEIKTSILQVLDGGIIESSTTNIGQGGLIDITADNLEINGRNGDRVSRISSQSQASTGISKGGDAGIIRINTQNLSIVNGGTISLETNNTGKGGNLFLNVVGNLQVRGSSINTNNQIDPSSISSSSQGAGDAGNLQIKASNLQILDGATIESATQNIGQGGLIDITADNLEINGRNGDRVSRISSQSQASTGLSKGGDAGIIRINTQNLSIGDGGAISLDTNTTGKGGNLFLNAAETVQVTENSSISSSSSGAGTAGNLDIKTGILRVLDGATIESATQNIGQGGLIDITADNLEINGISSAISSQSQASTGLSKGGDAGIIRINTQNLSIGDGGTISLETNTTGKGGNLFLNAAETVQVTENSSISSSSSGAGTAGNLDIKTGNLFVLDGGTIKASATNTSQAGNISINARTIRLEDKGKIRTDNKNLDGGNITLRASEILTLRRGGGISTNAGADGGNIKIDTPFILGVREENSDITANADAGGRGGNIKIKTQSIFGLERREKTTDFSDITASSAFGTLGIININNSAIEAQEVPPELPQEPLDAALLIDQALCSVGRTNELTVSGRGGLPSTPEQVISGNQPWEDWRSGTQTSQEQTPRTTVKETPRQLPLREFQGWTVNARGNIVLTAQANMITPQGDWIPPLGCQNLR